MSSTYLKVVRGTRRGANIPLNVDEKLRFGRNAGDVILQDPLVSGEHCRIEHRDGSWEIVDLESRNGVQVDGKSVSTAKLVAGSQIMVGSTLMVVVVTQEPTSMLEQSTAVATADTAWLLDEELIASKRRSSASIKTIEQGLFMPFRFSVAFEVLTGPRKGAQYDLNQGGAVIGRNHGDVPLADHEVSRKHAIVEVFGRRMIFIRDLNSTNGTFHNGRRVHVAKLQIGDNVSCGATTLRLVEPG